MDKVAAIPIKRHYQSMPESEMGFKVGPNVDFVVKNSLCHGCGTCEAACPTDAVKMYYEDRRAIYLPAIDYDKCDNCTICVQACSGFELDLTEKPDAQIGLKEHPLVGSYDAIYRSFTNDVKRRERASSGGIITEIVDHLMATEQVDGAIVTRMNKEYPLRAEGYIAHNSEDLLPSQKSKYCPVPLNRILKSLVGKKSVERYVFVGLPHHVHGLRLLQRIFPHLKESIPFVISSFTAHVPSQRATEFILYKKGIHPKDVKMIEYRGGGNPGRMRIVTKDEKEHFVPHFHWTYSGHSFPMFFYPVREWLYFDKMSEWADLTMGDNWMKGLEEQKGASSVIVRSKKAHEVIKELIAQNKIVATPMTADDLLKDQELRTKLNIYWRLKIWKWLGRKIPFYTRNFEILPGQRIKTIRFAVCILLSEHKIPFPIMDKIIQADYYLRARPKRLFKKLMHFAMQGVKMFAFTDKEIPKKYTKYKVILIGGYGYYDIGDEAMPHAIRNSLRERLGSDLEIMMLSPYPKCTVEMHGENSSNDFTHISYGKDAGAFQKFITFGRTCFLFIAVLLEKYFGLRLSLWENARVALDEIQSADLILNVGGGNINSVIPSELYKKSTTFIVAGILKKPVFLSGQTMGPYYGWFSKLYARYALNKVKMISFRDKDVSHARMKEIGVKNPEMFDAADDAISLKGIDPDRAQSLLEKETGLSFAALKKPLLVVLNMKASLNIFKGKGRSSGLGNEIALMAMLGDALIEKYSCNVVLMPTDFSENVDDRVPHREIYNLMRNKGSVYQITGSYIDDELIGMIGCADVAIGARYHFNVFAASRYTPFLGIASGVYQRTKLQGLAQLCGMNECYIDHDMEFVAFDDVWPSVVHIIENRAEITRNLIERVPQLKKNSLKVVDSVTTILKSSSRV